MAHYIEDWNQVPEGAYVIEDTYNEVYVLTWEICKETTSPSEYKVLPKNCTHIIWYNR